MSAYAPMAALPSLGKKANRLNAGSSNESAFRSPLGGDIQRVDASIAEAGAMLGKLCTFGNWFHHCDGSRKRRIEAKGRGGIYLRIWWKNSISIPSRVA
ncbi:hypothetical protein BPNPMPFG_001831 [Mesorhizobium sp. AR07]|uniref:hypothetical protein n=1 Tax=Mesorhizobium sp. AR07 TaxID=2865838 RepID=UPI00215F6F47|nr:hypothetical protein [Mesorhizobium sp. AR07]UVK46213.1 hypothetical protein BPNPMPFG_001831 [Mesorhizobium sp. AR07]